MRTAERWSRRHRPLILNAIAAAALALVVACGGGDSDPTVAAAATPLPTVAPEPVATTAPSPTESPDVDPTAIPTPVPDPTVTSTRSPTPTPSPTATPTPVVSNTFDEFGFTLQLDEDASFASSDFNLRGWTEAEASADQGLITFTYTGAKVVFFWAPENDDVPQTVVDSTYELQKLSQPDINFTPINEGDLTVDGEAGRFGGFLAADSSGENASGGLIGAWTCQTSGTISSLTVTGPDATALQIRFDRLISGFECGS